MLHTPNNKSFPLLLVFDLDGTLVDSRRDIADSANDMLESYGAAALPAGRIAAMVGEGARLLVRRALEAAGVQPDEDEALDRFRTFYDRRLVRHTRPYEGIEALLDAFAPRAVLAVLTNKPGASSRRLLDAFDLSRRFRWIIGGDADWPRKPDPAALRHLMREAGTTGERTLFVGDSSIDVATARAAGVPMAAALFGFGHERGDLVLAPEDLRAESVDELHQVIVDWIASRP